MILLLTFVFFCFFVFLRQLFVIGRLLQWAVAGDLVKVAENQVQLTSLGLRRAAELTKTHRLWEMYLMQQANIAADHVDRDADETEHLLPPAVRLELEQQLEKAGRLPRALAVVPQSPHELEPPPEPKDQKTQS